MAIGIPVRAIAETASRPAIKKPNNPETIAWDISRTQNTGVDHHPK